MNPDNFAHLGAAIARLTLENDALRAEVEALKAERDSAVLASEQMFEWANQIANDERVTGWVHGESYGLYCLLADPPCTSTGRGRELLAEVEALRVNLAGIRAYAMSLRAAAEPFCSIKADDGDTFNGYAPETIVRYECTVNEIRRLRMCAGYGSLSGCDDAINGERKA